MEAPPCLEIGLVEPGPHLDAVRGEPVVVDEEFADGLGALLGQQRIRAAALQGVALEDEDLAAVRPKILHSRRYARLAFSGADEPASKTATRAMVRSGRGCMASTSSARPGLRGALPWLARRSRSGSGGRLKRRRISSKIRSLSEASRIPVSPMVRTLITNDPMPFAISP